MKNQTFGIEIETTGLGGECTAMAIAAAPEPQPRYVGRHLGDVCVDEGESGIEMVQEVVRAIREAGARTDSSCGIHVHVGFGEHTPASLRRLVNIVSIGHHCPSGSAGYAPSMLALTVASRAEPSLMPRRTC